jgi:hypothetical protein
LDVEVMMDLTTPTDHAMAYEWLVVLMAHGGVGLFATACLAALLRDGALAWVYVAIIYAVMWEGAVQHYGAGIGDAAVDTFAVAAGGLMGWLAWERRGVLLALVFAIFAAVAAIGVRSRK